MVHVVAGLIGAAHQQVHGQRAQAFRDSGPAGSVGAGNAAAGRIAGAAEQGLQATPESSSLHYHGIPPVLPGSPEPAAF